jgi:hypothetical protein
MLSLYKVNHPELNSLTLAFLGVAGSAAERPVMHPCSNVRRIFFFNDHPIMDLGISDRAANRGGIAMLLLPVSSSFPLLVQLSEAIALFHTE